MSSALTDWIEDLDERRSFWSWFAGLALRGNDRVLLECDCATAADEDDEFADSC